MKVVSTLVASSAALLAGISTVDAFGWGWGSSPAKSLVEADPMQGAIDLVCKTKYPLETEKEQFIQVTQSFWTNLESDLNVDDGDTSNATKQLKSAKERLDKALELTESCEKNYLIREFENQVKEALETIKTKAVHVGVSCTNRLFKELELDPVDDSYISESKKTYLSEVISKSSEIVSDINSLHELAADSVKVTDGRNVDKALKAWVDEKLLNLKGYKEILEEPKDQETVSLCEGIRSLESALKSTLVFDSMMKDFEGAAAVAVAVENETKTAYSPQEVELVGSEQGLMSDNQPVEAPKAKRGFFSFWGNKSTIDELIDSLKNVKATEKQLERIIRAYNEEFTLLIDALKQAEQQLIEHLDSESLVQYVEALRVIKMKVAAIHHSLSLCVGNNFEEVDRAFDAFVERAFDDLNRCRLAAALQGLYYAANTNKASINSEQLKMLLALSGLVSDSVDLNLSLPSNYLEPLRSLQAKVLLQSEPEGDSSANDIETLLRLTRKVSFFLHFVSDGTDLMSSAQDPFTKIFPPVAAVSLDPSEIVELMYSDPNGPDSNFFYERYVSQFHKKSNGLLRALEGASTLQEEVQQLRLLKDLCMNALNELQSSENETVESIKAFYLQVTLLLSRIRRKALMRVEHYLFKNLTIDLPRRNDYETIAAFASALYSSVPNAEVVSIQIDSLVTVADLSDFASFEADDKAKLQLETTFKCLLGTIQSLAQFYPGLDEIESHMPQNATLQKTCRDTASRLSRLEEMLVSLMHRYKDAMISLNVPVPDTDVVIQPEVRLTDKFTGEFKSGNILLSMFGKDDTTIHRLIDDSIFDTNKLKKILPAYEKLFSGLLKKLPTVISRESASKYMHELVGIKKEVQNVYVSLNLSVSVALTSPKKEDWLEPLENIRASVIRDFNHCKLLAAVKAIEYATQHGSYIPKVPKQRDDEDDDAFSARLQGSLPDPSTLTRHLTRFAAIADNAQDLPALSEYFDTWLQVSRERIEQYRQVLGQWEATVQNLNMSNTVLKLKWKLYQLQQVVQISSHIVASLVCNSNQQYSGNQVFAQLIHVPSYDLPSFEEALEQICSESPRESATHVFELIVYGLGAHQDYNIGTLIDGSAEEKTELFNRLRDDSVTLQGRLEQVETCQVLNTPLSEFKTSSQSQLEKIRSAVFDKLVAHWSIDPENVLGVVPEVEGSFTHVLNNLNEQITMAKKYADQVSFLLDLAELAPETPLITSDNMALYKTARQHINGLLSAHSDYSASLEQLKEKHSKNWLFDTFSESKWNPVVAKLSSFHEIMERCSQVMTEQSKLVDDSDYNQDLNMVVQEPTVNVDTETQELGSETLGSSTESFQVNVASSPNVEQEPESPVVGGSVQQSPVPPMDIGNVESANPSEFEVKHVEETTIPGSEGSELLGHVSQVNPDILPVFEQTPEPTKEESSSTDIAHVTTIAQESVVDSSQVFQEPTGNADIGTQDLGSETIESSTKDSQVKVEREPESPVVGDSAQQYSVPSVSDVGSDNQSKFEEKHVDVIRNPDSEGSESATQEFESNRFIPPVVEQTPESTVMGNVGQQSIMPVIKDPKAIPVENKLEPTVGKLSSKKKKPVITNAQENLGSPSATVHNLAVQRRLAAEPSNYYTGTSKLTLTDTMERPVGGIVTPFVPMSEPVKQGLGSIPASVHENPFTPTIPTSDCGGYPQSSSFSYMPPKITSLTSDFNETAATGVTPETSLPGNRNYSSLLLVTVIGAFFILVGVGLYAFLV